MKKLTIKGKNGGQTYLVNYNVCVILGEMVFLVVFADFTNITYVGTLDSK